MEIVNTEYHLEGISADGTVTLRSALKIGHESLVWNYVAQDGDQWREFLICNECWVYIQRRIFLTTSKTVSFPRRILVYELINTGTHYVIYIVQIKFKHHSKNLIKIT